MKLLRRINTSVLLVEDALGKEQIVLGKGISFHVDEAGCIDDGYIEKRFYLETKQDINRFIALVERIPMVYISFCEEMITLMNKQLNCTLASNIYLSLPDHIAFAVERYQKGIETPNMMLHEVQTFYPKEFEVALDVVSKVNQTFDVRLKDDEATFIAFHIINAMLGVRDATQTLKMTAMISKILAFVEEEIGYMFDQDSLEYHRLVVHIKFFVQRLLFKKQAVEQVTGVFDTLFKENNVYTMTLNIVKKIETTFDVVVSATETEYMAIYVLRLGQLKKEIHHV